MNVRKPGDPVSPDIEEGMREFCPESELVAAAAENRLTADDEWKLLNHAAVCDDCRRELAIVRLRADAEPEPLPQGLNDRLRALAPRAETKRRTRSFRPTRHSPAAALAAVLLLSLVAVLLVVYYRHRSGPEAPPLVLTPYPKLTQPTRDEDRRPGLERPWSPQDPESRRVPRSDQRPDRQNETADDFLDDPTPKPKDNRETVARVFSELTLTDVGGELAVLRGRERRPARGIVTVSDGDVLVAEKPVSFHIEGRHAVVLPADARVSVASSATEQATWLAVRSGHVLVQPDPTGGSRWAISDGRRTIVVEKTRSRFAASRDESGLSLTPLGDAMRVTADGEAPADVPAGQEWTPGGVVRSARVSNYQGQLAANLPRERSVFFADCTPEDVRRGRWSLVEGVLEKERSGRAVEPFIRAVERRQRLVASIRLEARVTWDLDYVVRLRCRTSAKSFRIEIPLPQNQGMLLGEVEIPRDSANRWITVELALHKFDVVGAGRILLNTYDRMESMEFSVAQKPTHGGAAHLEVDHIQILDR